jgi:hypothetical protein
VNETSKKKSDQGEEMPATERRRIGQVVHDDRGNASVSWRDAPADYERPVLEVLGGNSGLSVKTDESNDPYSRSPPRTSSTPTPQRRDLRKLSEHIKRMRELEQRKRNGGGEQD